MSDAGGTWDKGYEWKAVLLLTLGFGLVGLDRWVIADLAAAKGSTMIQDLHLTNPGVQIGMLVAALGVAWGVSAVVMGGLSDRFGRRKILVAALIVFSLLSGFSGLTASFAAMLMMRILMGLAEGAYCPVSFAAVSEATKPQRRGFNMGLQQSAFALFGLGFGPIIATQLLPLVGWRGVFLLVGIPGLIIAFMVSRIIREPAAVDGEAAQSSASTPKPKLREMLSHRNVPLSLAGLMCAMCGIFVISAFTPAYLTEHLKLGDQQMGFIVSAIGFGGFLGQWWLCALSDFLGRRNTAVIGFLIGAVFLVLFMRTGPENSLLLFVLLFISVGFAFGLLSLITGPIAAEAAPLGMAASTTGLIVSVGEIFGGGFAPAIAGAMASHWNIQSTLYLALGGLVVGVAVSAFYQETAPRKVASAAAALVAS